LRQPLFVLVEVSGAFQQNTDFQLLSIKAIGDDFCSLIG